ncbi:hypothetical protein HDE_10580 [Halotydeus destructor]|nr:hypothetical protein HDE_10580 [Halotydeus destructor]
MSAGSVFNEDKFNPEEDFAQISKLSLIIDDTEKKLSKLDRDVTGVPACDLKRLLSLNYNERGFHYYKRVEFDDAVRDYTKSIEYGTSRDCSPDKNTLSAALYNRGTVMYRMSDFSKAKIDFERALVLKPDNQEFRRALSATHEQLESRFTSKNGNGS